MKLHVQLISSDEIEIVLELFKEAAKNIQSKGETQWKQWLNPEQKDVDWITDGFSKNEFYYVINENNKVVGMFRYLIKDEIYWNIQHEQARYVHSLVVKKEFSGLNLGAKILKLVEQKILMDECSIFRLDCNASNEFLTNYYVSNGFSKVGEFINHRKLTFNLYEKIISDITNS